MDFGSKSLEEYFALIKTPRKHRTLVSRGLRDPGCRWTGGPCRGRADTSASIRLWSMVHRNLPRGSVSITWYLGSMSC